MFSLFFICVSRSRYQGISKTSRKDYYAKFIQEDISRKGAIPASETKGVSIYSTVHHYIHWHFLSCKSKSLIVSLFRLWGFSSVAGCAWPPGWVTARSNGHTARQQDLGETKLYFLQSLCLQSEGIKTAKKTKKTENKLLPPWASSFKHRNLNTCPRIAYHCPGTFLSHIMKQCL